MSPDQLLRRDRCEHDNAPDVCPACELRDLDRRWRRACELGDALATAAKDVLEGPPAGHHAPFIFDVLARKALARAIADYEEG